MLTDALSILARLARPVVCCMYSQHSQADPLYKPAPVSPPMGAIPLDALIFSDSHSPQRHVKKGMGVLLKIPRPVLSFQLKHTAPRLRLKRTHDDRRVFERRKLRKNPLCRRRVPAFRDAARRTL